MKTGPGADDYSAHAPAVPATYRLDDEIEKKNKPEKRSVFEGFPEGRKMQDRFPGFLSQLLY